MKCLVTGEPNCKCTIAVSSPLDTYPKETLRKLWTDHAMYTILVLTDMIHQTEDTMLQRLLQNQIEIGTYIGSFIGIQEGSAIVYLLTEYVTCLVKCIKTFLSNQFTEFISGISNLMDNANQCGSYFYRIRTNGSNDIQEEECCKWFTTHCQHVIDLIVTIYHNDTSLRSRVIDSYYNYILYVSDMIYSIIIL